MAKSKGDTAYVKPNHTDVRSNLPILTGILPYKAFDLLLLAKSLHIGVRRELPCHLSG